MKEEGEENSNNQSYVGFNEGLLEGCKEIKMLL
jgi:hypothetical protein